MDPHCRVEMLGPLRLIRGGEALTRFGTQKAAALLAYLALRPGPQPREHLIDLFWPDMDLTAGRNNLNTALSSLRRHLEPPGVRRGDVLITTHAHAGLASDAVSTDVAELERLLRQSDDADAPETRVHLRSQALALYGGDFQPGNYQDWAVRESERLAACRVEAMDRLGSDLEMLGRYAEAAAVAQRRLDADSYAEGGHVALIRRHVLAGQTTAAQKARRKFDQSFREEFGAGPSAEAQRAVEAIFAMDAPGPLQAPGRHAPEDTPADEVAEPAGPVTADIGRSPSATLPFWLSRFFGREAEMAQLAGHLLPSKASPSDPYLPEHGPRLLTLTGPGGIGKTRLIVEFARRASERAGHWCGFVLLAGLSAASQLPGQIAQSLCLPTSETTPPLEQIIAFFADRHRPGSPPALLILDNLEHLLTGTDSGDAAGVVRVLLERAPGLTILCTSRRRLGLQGERLVPLAPLPVPEMPGFTASAVLPEFLLEFASVRLYVDRAQAVRPDFSLTATNAPAVAALCRVLEGSPLALELAASWVRLLPPRRMWERLSSGQAVPRGEYADLPPRHRSLEAALDWSWRLLSPDQQHLLARVSVFRGGWTLEAAEVVGEAPNTLGLLAGLQEASLLTTHENEAGEIRYGLLETVRRFTGDRLQESGERDAAERRHQAWCSELAEGAYPHLRGPERGPWLRKLEAEHDNLRAALERCLAQQDTAEAGLRMAGALWQFWQTRGHNSEGRQWLTRALERAAGTEATVAHTRALTGAANLAFSQTDYNTARALYEECLAIDRRAGNETGIGLLLNNLGVIATDQGDYDKARALHEESLAIRRRLGDEKGMAFSLHNLGRLLWHQGDATACAFYEQSLAIRRRLGDEAGVAFSLNNLGITAEQQGDHAAARRMHEESLAIRRRLGDEGGTADSLDNLGNTLQSQGDHAAGRVMNKESLAIRRRTGNKLGAVWSLGRSASLALELGQTGRAVRLLGASDSLRRAIDCPPCPDEEETLAKWLSAARARLGDAAFEVAWAEGQAMPWEEAVQYALSDNV